MHGDKPHYYKIEILGCLDPTWSDWFNGLSISAKADQTGGLVTILTGAITDQAALRGILGKIWDLNLSVASIQRIDQTHE